MSFLYQRHLVTALTVFSVLVLLFAADTGSIGFNRYALREH